MSVPATTCSTVAVDGVEVFYRSAGDPAAPVVLLLHGFPTSSHQYRHLIPALALKYRVIAPDFPGFGFTVVPASRKYEYTFDNLSKTLEAFTHTLELHKFAIYIFDYGAPTGLRLALARPDAITAFISQNGNAFEEGFGDFWDLIKPYWKDPSPAVRESMHWLASPETTKSQYTGGEANPASIPPESYTLDQALLERPGNAEIQLDLILDYRNNVPLYPAFQAYLRERQPPVLAIWGKNDTIFVPAGAEAFKQVVKDVQVHLVDGGHFPLENHLEEVAGVILEFLGKNRV
ncbi:alpha/beta-hydrolase [Athelia psychrophila]|uniref:Alpha/beta-hydrolase n=1 Tax=Athelia psychrophila TaxID=1759441 RepID=A0A166M534_9AGAM|nr:alpha/beta-hydrolase [Fibularhizoctonia sp. CBS 109695]